MIPSHLAEVISKQTVEAVARPFLTADNKCQKREMNGRWNC